MVPARGGVAQWDEVPVRMVEAGHLRAAWRDLAQAAGSEQLGVRRITLPAGGFPTPLHAHSAEEEFFYVLAGSGLSLQDSAAYEIATGDLLHHPPEGPAHTLQAGLQGLDVLAFGTRVWTEATHLPRAGLARIGDTWAPAGGPHPYLREADAGPPEAPDPSPRPPSIVALAEVPETLKQRARCDLIERDAGAVLGRITAGLAHVRIAPGAEGWPPHCHSSEEELYVVLAGEGELELLDAGAEVVEAAPLREGTVVSRPAGTGLAHVLRAGGAGLEYLVFGMRVPDDQVFYPRSQKLSLRGLGVIVRIAERADYWDGEE